MAPVLAHNRFSWSNIAVLPGMLILFLILMSSAFAGQASLAWDGNGNSAIAGYMLYYGQSSRNYTSKVDVGSKTTYSVAGLLEGKTYFYAVTAYDSSRTESAYSNEASSTVPYATPQANFSSNTVAGIAPLTVAFTNTSTGTVTAYSWSFGDGTLPSNRTSANPTHPYTAAGGYTATLTVTGPGGATSKSSVITVTAPTTPPPSAPVASFTPSVTTGPAPLAVSFTDHSSGSITSWAWNFGDNTSPSNAQSPSHSYAAAGAYTATLTVTGPGGATSKASVITVTAPTTPPPSAPVASFTPSVTSGPAPLAVSFTDRSTGSITSRAWNFGDNTSPSSAQSPSHSYAAAGAYTVTLTVTGPGGTNSKSSLITVTTPSAPVASFTPSVTSGPAPLAVSFTDRSTGTITSRAWNFGDQTSPSIAQSPSHTYAAAGTYAVTLTVVGPGGSNTSPPNFITVTQPTTGKGSLAGSAAPSLATVNLPSVGSTDWAHWPGYDHKASGGSKISTYTRIGNGTISSYSNDLRTMGWSAGAPTAGGSNRNGVFIAGIGNGFQVNAPADTSLRKLSVYVGGWVSGGKLTAHLSDNSAADYVNSSLSGSGQYDGVYTLTYKAASAGQTISVKWTQASGTGNVTLQGAALAPGTGTVPPPSTGPAGLVASYSFDEGSGSRVSDLSGNANAGTISGASWEPVGRYGKALSFNGSSSWVTVQDSPALDLASGMTMEAWVYPKALSGWMMLMMKEQPGSDVYYLSANSDKDQPATGVFIGSQQKLYAGKKLATFAWTHLAATYDGVTQRLYINGVQVASRLQTGAVQSSSSPLRIGGDSVWGQYFNGLIDEVRIYNRALSPSEIQADMNAPVGK